MSIEDTQEHCRQIVDQLKSANPDQANKFRAGTGEMSVLFDVDNKKSCILYSAGIDGKFYPCRMDDGSYPTIEKR